MALKRYRSLEESGRALWHAPDDPALLREFRSLWRLGDWLAPWTLPPGVHRFRSIEAMNRQREAWEHERVRPRFQPTPWNQGQSA